MTGTLPRAIASPAPSLGDFRWWYITPGRLFGLRLGNDGRPLEVALGFSAAAPAADASGQNQSHARPEWCPGDETSTYGYMMSYAEFPLTLDQIRALLPRPGANATVPPGVWEPPPGNPPSGSVEQNSDSPALREEVDLGVQLQFPVCSFLSEAREDLRLHTHYAAQGQMILTRFGDRIGVATTVHNLLPLQDPLPPGLYYYEAWLELVDNDGVVKVAVPAGAVSVSDDGTGTGFRELDAINVDGTGLPIEAFNGTSITAQARDGATGQSEYAALEGTLPRTVKW